MLAIEAATFSGYGGLRQTESPRPQAAEGGVLVRVTAAGVTPLDRTIPSGRHPRAKGPYGVGEAGTWQDWLLVRPEHLTLVPDAIEDVVAASLPAAYLTAQVTLTLAGFKRGMTVLTPGIGGSLGNATYQLARAHGAGQGDLHGRQRVESRQSA